LILSQSELNILIQNYVQFQFQFADYRQASTVNFPFSVYFDFYRATFRYTMVNNKPLPDSDFVAKRAKP
jgi:hypothetical protein